MDNNSNDKILSCAHCAQNGNALMVCACKSTLVSFDLEKETKYFKKGEYLFKEGYFAKGLYCLDSGEVKLSRAGDNGREAIIRLVKGGDSVGYKSLITNRPFTASCVAMGDVCACFIPKETFMNSLKVDSGFSMGFLEKITNDLYFNEIRATHLVQKPVLERLAETLLYLRNKFGEDASGFLNLILSREEYGNIIGTATESIIRLLSQLKKNGLIEFQQKKIKILQLERLIDLANLQD